MKEYNIAYQYTNIGTIKVKANSLEEAKELALEASANNLHNEEYLDDSFEINEEMTDHLNGRYNIV